MKLAKGFLVQDYRTQIRLLGWFRLCLIILLLLRLPVGSVAAAENPFKVKAAFLRNFAHYVNWPNDAFSDSVSPWCIGILGPDPFGEVLETVLAGRTEKGRTFTVLRANKPEDLRRCQIVYITYTDAGARRTALRSLNDKPILTVGDAPDFLNEGGVIRFQVGDRVSMSINLDQARAVLLTIQTKMLEVSSEILENGAIRRMK